MTNDIKIKTAKNMMKYGGGFVSGLGKALASADTINTNIIIMAWPDLIEKYKNL